ncbi:peptide transporter family 2 isoform X2 [Nilaparvata lugens]|uniref:peptide transporter family 2 isoform X2 n=1 Tax=Nilaparvata lugens TaxID=108931 RepID=UPI00193CB74F|nr:peptide transporter family 2 isoform X2 [Nilaparvata lugens]
MDSKASNGTSQGTIDVENSKRLKYPKSVFFIISNEFCERFSYYGMRTILALYLQNQLKYSETDSTLIYHSFVMLCYFFPLFGAILADSFLGKFKTIFYLSVVYAIGSITLSYSSTGLVPFPERYAALLGLLLVALGTGGIKPCVSSFGGDQFTLPQQQRQLEQFFSVFYFSINAGSVLSTFLTPELRQGVTCLGQDTCYPLAFGVPAVLMVVSLIIFVAGKWMYKMKKPGTNVILDVTKCSLFALKQKICSSEKKDHWLDHAKGRFSNRLVEDCKVVMSIILLFSPTILFWSLFEQQGTTWTFQATRMNGELGAFTIKPDQMQVINPVLIMLFIPIFEIVIYPLLAKLRIVRTSLQKLVVGGLLVALSFVIAGLVETKIQPSYAILPQKGEAQLRLINGYDCDVGMKFVNKNPIDDQIVDKFDILQLHSIKNITGFESYNVSLSAKGCPGFTGEVKDIIGLTEMQSTTYYLREANGKPSLIKVGNNFDVIKKSELGAPQLRVVYNADLSGDLEFVKESKTVFKFVLKAGDSYVDTKNINNGRFTIKLNGKELPNVIDIEFAGVYTLMIEKTSNSTVITRLYTITSPNTVHILWQLPQILVLTAAEIMFSITGLEFSYSQAPKSMKSVMSSLWLLTDALGNALVVVFEEFLRLDSQVKQFFLFAGLMVFVMLVFALLAMRYEYVTPKEDDEEEERDEQGGMREERRRESNGEKPMERVKSQTNPVFDSTE